MDSPCLVKPPPPSFTPTSAPLRYKRLIKFVELRPIPVDLTDEEVRSLPPTSLLHRLTFCPLPSSSPSPLAPAAIPANRLPSPLHALATCLP